MGIIKEIWAMWHRQSDFDAKKENDKPADDNIRPTLICAEVRKQSYYRELFWTTQMKFKYRFFVPLVLIAEKVLGKFMVKQIPDTPYNQDFFIFSEAMEKSIKDWAWCFMKEPGVDKVKTPEWLDDFHANSSQSRVLRTLKRIILTVCINDTAYRALFEVFIRNITYGMNKAYHGTDTHIFYTGKDLDNQQYFKVMGTNEANLKIKADKGYYYFKKGDGVFLKECPLDYNEQRKI